MKIIIEIPDEEIEAKVFRRVTEKIANVIFEERYSYDKNVFERTLKTGVNTVLKDRADEIIERCIPQASAYIGKKGVKKFLDSIKENGGVTHEAD